MKCCEPRGGSEGLQMKKDRCGDKQRERVFPCDPSSFTIQFRLSWGSLVYVLPECNLEPVEISSRNILEIWR